MVQNQYMNQVRTTEAAATTVWPLWGPSTVVVPTTVVAIGPSNLLDFFAAFHVPRALYNCSLKFCNKRWFLLLCWHSIPFQSLTPIILFRISIRLEEERANWSEDLQEFHPGFATMVQAQSWLSISFLFFTLLFLGFIFCNFDYDFVVLILDLCKCKTAFFVFC